MADRQYWVRTEKGITLGPYPRAKMERLRGQLTARTAVSLDGVTYEPIDAFPELAELVAAAAAPPARAVGAEGRPARAGGDALSTLSQLKLVPPADAHRVLGEHALYLLDRALSTWRGRFSFEPDAPAPPGAYPLGSKWALLAE